MATGERNKRANSLGVALTVVLVGLVTVPAVAQAHSKPKTLMNSQKLANALKACKKDESKSKRAACEKQARKSYTLPRGCHRSHNRHHPLRLVCPRGKRTVRIARHLTLMQAMAHPAQIVKAVEAASTGPGCTPSPAFTVGVQDDSVFLGHNPAMSPSQGFDLASSVFSAHLLRLNVIWGQVQMYGWAPYDQAVQMARDRGWAVQMTIMPTPTYMESYLNDALSTDNLDLGVLASFAGEVATRYARQVARYSIGNEPNYWEFLQGDDMAAYDRMYLAGYDAIKAADPAAQVIAGEILAITDILPWLANLDGLPSDGIAIHLYWLTQLTGQFASMIHHPLLDSEDGEQASDPNQLADDLQLEAWARCGGATQIVFYQLSRAASNSFWWDTGIQ